FIRLLTIQAFVSCVAPYTLITFGQRTVASSLAAILNSSTPLIVCVISVLWAHQETLTPRRLFGVAIGFAGVIGITGVSALFALGDQLLGQAMIIIATVSSAVGVIHGRHFDDVAPEVVAAGMLSAAAILLLPLSLLLETPWPAPPSAASLTALVVNAVIATAFGFVVYFQLIRRIGSVGTSSASYVKPMAGVLIGCGFLGEPLTWSLAAGTLAILIGVAAINSPEAGARLEQK